MVNIFFLTQCLLMGDNPRWLMVDVKWKEAFWRMVTLREMRNTPQLSGMKLMQKGQLLSVMLTRAGFTRALGRPVSTTLRHLAHEFTDVSPLFGRPPDAAC